MKKFFSIVLSAMMVVALMPVFPLAEEPAAEGTEAQVEQPLVEEAAGETAEAASEEAGEEVAAPDEAAAVEEAEEVAPAEGAKEAAEEPSEATKAKAATLNAASAENEEDYDEEYNEDGDEDLSYLYDAVPFDEAEPYSVTVPANDEVYLELPVTYAYTQIQVKGSNVKVRVLDENGDPVYDSPLGDMADSCVTHTVSDRRFLFYDLDEYDTYYLEITNDNSSSRTVKVMATMVYYDNYDDEGDYDDEEYEDYYYDDSYYIELGDFYLNEHGGGTWIYEYCPKLSKERYCDIYVEKEGMAAVDFYVINPYGNLVANNNGNKITTLKNSYYADLPYSLTSYDDYYICVTYGLGNSDMFDENEYNDDFGIAISPRNMQNYYSTNWDENRTYTGSRITQAPELYYGDVFLSGYEYTTSYTYNLSVGTATAKFTGKSPFYGTKTRTFKIIPKGTSLTGLTKASKAFTAKWNKQATKMSVNRITGYQIQYSRDKNFSKNVYNKYVKGYANTSTKITGLSSGVTYYVRIRTYMKVGDKYYNSWWSSSKSVKTN